MHSLFASLREHCQLPIYFLGRDKKLTRLSHSPPTHARVLLKGAFKLERGRANRGRGEDFRLAKRLSLKSRFFFAVGKCKNEAKKQIAYSQPIQAIVGPLRVA